MDLDICIEGLWITADFVNEGLDGKKVIQSVTLAWSILRPEVQPCSLFTKTLLTAGQKVF